MKINIFFSRPRRAFFKIVCGLNEEMKRKDENRALGNWILASNFLKKIFRPLFLRADCSQSQDASVLMLLWPCVWFFELSE
jgi:hypothetical protein